MSRKWAILLLLSGTVLGLSSSAEGQFLPFAWQARPKVLFRYGRGKWAYSNYQRFYDPDRQEYFWGWFPDYYGIDYNQTPLSKIVPSVMLVDFAGGVGWNLRGHILVRVPNKNAEVWFNDYLTPQVSYERSFDTPPLKAGEPAIYQVRARWPANGGFVERSSTVRLEPGEEVVVDFITPPVER